MDNNNILYDLSKNTDIKNLINLSSYSDINISKKNKNQRKSKKRVLKECENNKKDIPVISNLANLIINDDIIDNLNKEKYIECYSN